MSKCESLAIGSAGILLPIVGIVMADVLRRRNWEITAVALAVFSIGVGCAAAVINAALGRQNASCCCVSEQSDTLQTF